MTRSQTQKTTFATALAILFACVIAMGQEPNIQESHPFTNGLIHESSKYLLEHAHNPVNWQPWSDTIIKEAEQLNKLIIVSVGYSSCHWCHVMAKETFEDEEAAQLMNTNFINIKVDREERPDIDQLYMTAVQLIKGQGGWPLNVILLPNGKPLYGGTYHTKEQWMGILRKIADLYSNTPEKLYEFGNKITDGIASLNLTVADNTTNFATKDQLVESVNEWQNSWDTIWGGTKAPEKFMLPENLTFLLDYGILFKNDAALKQVETTLDRLLLGGINDHIEGGFYRYSTDPYWKLPHFEKMLYDNAQLVSLYAKAYSVFKKDSYKEVVVTTLAFLESKMKNSAGGFFATIDADSDGKEGAYYLWSEAELSKVITTRYDLFAKYFNIDIQDEIEGGNYVLHNSMNKEEFAKTHHLNLNDFIKLRNQWISTLKTHRKLRIAPHIDKKIIASWNALMITGYIDAYRSLGSKNYLEEAQKTMDFIKTKMYLKGSLSHSMVNDQLNTNGFIEDYAFLINASLNLYSVSLDQSDLNFAQELLAHANTLFYDEVSSLYRYTSHSKHIAKIIKTDDGVMSSPNSVMALNLLRLGHLLYRKDYMEKSDSMLKTVQPQLLSQLNSYSVWGSLLLKKTHPYYEVAIVGNDAKKLLQDLTAHYTPNTLIIGTPNKSNLPLFEGRFVNNETYIYVCQNSTCKLPVATVKEALLQME
ncbi:thioredoxin domain-containing protein [Maribacter sp. LLG6340-A2]|uniref:thioredoxin domain-containing protein n=1 Tax=Maribacter sp. LLG6340-A2 TaxID=3160834 RepID=UPI00386C0A3B